MNLCGIFSTLIFLYYYWISIVQGTVFGINLGRFIQADLLALSWDFLFDTKILVMCFVISIVSSSVFFYAEEYMEKDPAKLKFFVFLNLFVFFMYLFLISESYVLMFFGWEGIGLCSFLLIAFWSTRISAVKAATKAVLANKIGDLGYIWMLCVLIYGLGTLSSGIASLGLLRSTLLGLQVGSPLGTLSLLTIVLLGGFVAMVGKSAQIGLHIWLPDAMEGPTPVSALLHAATMVTAGIFLVLKSFSFFDIEGSNFFFFFFGGLTALYASILGLCQEDIKKSIAYSTCSQLGYMVLVCSLAEYSTAFFHMFNHAFFKALLFLAAGCLIHSSTDEQDLRILGGFTLRSPLIFAAFTVGGSSLMALPYLAGFFSKEVIINIGILYHTLTGGGGFYLGALGAIITCLYTFCNIFDTFYSNLHPRYLLFKFHLTTRFMAYTLASLLVLSICSGIIFNEVFIGIGVAQMFKPRSLAVLSQVDLETLSFGYRVIPLYLNLALVAALLSIGDRFFLFGAKYIYSIFDMNMLYFKVFTKRLWNLIEATVRLLERGLVERFGPEQFFRQSLGLGSLTLRLLYSSIQGYLLYVLITLGCLSLIV